jgi:hypothetical protein
MKEEENLVQWWNVTKGVPCLYRMESGAVVEWNKGSTTLIKAGTHRTHNWLKSRQLKIDKEQRIKIHVK